MSKRNNINNFAEQIEALAKGVQTTSIGVSMLAQQMVNERERTNELMTATFEALSRRERPVFVKTLRKDGWTQQEIGDAIGRSQSSIFQYEKKYDQQNPEN